MADTSPKSRVLDRWGNPVERKNLTKEIAAPSDYGVRTPHHHGLTDGLDPLRLSQILREADMGDPIRYLELAEVIEERDLHYVGILGTRKRSVAQLEITLDAASEDPQDVKIAEEIRDWLKRDELQEELFDIMDALGKGYSFTEIIWERPGGFWQPERLAWRDPRWFRFHRRDLTTPLLLDEAGAEQPLPAFRFIYATMKAKSGLALRSGLARIAAWAWMFKAFTGRDWAIFTQTYGQPIRIGRYQEGATDEDIRVLRRALTNIAGDCAAMMPASMMMEFLESKSIGASVDLYEKRSDWLDKQMSKAVLGQTSSADAIVGGLGSSKEHRQVQEDIERADAMALAAILNRDLIRPWVQLNYGPQERYPRLRIARPEVEDVTKIASAVVLLRKAGLTLSKSQIRSRVGFEEPSGPDDILGVDMQNSPEIGAQDASASDDPKQTSKIKRFSGGVKRVNDADGGEIALMGEEALRGQKTGVSQIEEDPVDPISDRLVDEMSPHLAEIFDVVEQILGAASDLEEAQEMIRMAYPGIEKPEMAQMLARAFASSEAGGFLDGVNDSE
jgi:phage gp29-like protein